MGWRYWLTQLAVHGAIAIALLALLRTRWGESATRRIAGLLSRVTPPTAIVLLVTATALRLALIPAVRPVYEADMREYVEKAAAIARDGHPRAQETRADGSRFYRPLGYSLPLAGWFKVTSTRSVRSAQAFNVLVACGIVALLLALARAPGQKLAGRLAALCYAAHLPAVVFNLLPYTETWTTLLLLAVALLYEPLRTGSPCSASTVARAAALGLVEGLVAITRTEFLWLPLLTGGLLLYEHRHALARASVPIAASLFAFLVPLAVNHELRSGYPGHLRTSVQGGLILYFGNNPIEVNGYGNATPEVAAKVRELYARDPTGALARDEALAWMKAHPFAVVGNAVKKLYHLWLVEPQGFGWHVGAGRDGGMDPRLAAVLRHLGYVQSLALLTLGVLGLVRRRPEYRLWTLLLVLHLATWCLLAASARNRYPLEPFLLLAASAWLTGGGRGTASRR